MDEWTAEAETAFENSKAELAKATSSPVYIDARTRLVTDADFAMSAVLEQQCLNSRKPLIFFSKKFTPAQKNYSAYDRKLTAIYEAIKYFRHFLEGRQFKILTDTNS